MFKLIARTLRALDNTVAIVENVTEAGEVASRSTIKLAENFDQEQQAKLDHKKAQLTKSLEEGTYKFEL